MPTPYDIAKGYTGLHERRDEGVLRDFLYNGGQNLTPAQRAWCADFVNASVKASGGVGTGSGMARSFMNWGHAVDKPREGDIGVFSRGSDPSLGHVGFFKGYDANGNIRLLSGNSKNSVSESVHPTSTLLGFRRQYQEPYDVDNNPNPPELVGKLPAAPSAPQQDAGVNRLLELAKNKQKQDGMNELAGMFQNIGKQQQAPSPQFGYSPMPIDLRRFTRV